ncbi:hypothetical protein [Paenibacillus ginsengarvi]|uniref:hypothetical protein n=1 Tax=Paenibacillus ginsengarvi TaxID=400777 RepID=UPI00195FC11C|nr:hypothetical protein [Paenibacillus ginsengarvi]
MDSRQSRLSLFVSLTRTHGSAYPGKQLGVAAHGRISVSAGMGNFQPALITPIALSVNPDRHVLSRS